MYRQHFGITACPLDKGNKAMGILLPAMVLPTARAARGEPTCRASSE